MGKNLKMNDDVYTLRRKVIDEIYVAKNLLRQHGIELPRLDVRITDNSGCNALGMARLNQNIIWISKDGLNYYGKLREIVFHEIVHAVTGFEHDTNCVLMCPCCSITKLDENLLNQTFIKYFKNK